MEMHAVVPGCPDFTWCELTVRAADVRLLRPFLTAAAGPGFIDWRPNWWSVHDRLYWQVRAAARPFGREAVTSEAARGLAWLYADAGARLLDLASLIPIPDSVLECGFEPDGERWLLQHWGTPAPLRRVPFRMVPQRSRNDAVDQVGVFRFLAENWAPWLALRSIKAQWPEIRFAMSCRYG
jgi:hypothetical protein